jgi:hypothetical protein
MERLVMGVFLALVVVTALSALVRAEHARRNDH